MIKAAPICSDPARMLLRASARAFPVAFVSDPREVGPLNRFSIITAFPLAFVTAETPSGPVRLDDLGEPGKSHDFPSLKQAAEAGLAMLGPPWMASEAPWGPEGSPFTGGLAGSLDYEFGGHFERMPSRIKEGPLPLLRFGLYASAYIMDHLRGRAWWVRRSGETAAPGVGDRIAASAELLRAWIESELETAPSSDDLCPAPALAASSFPGDRGDWREGWTPSLDRSAYAHALSRIHRYLHEGDIYQANLTVRYRRPGRADPRQLFRHLMRENPSPYAAFLASPEGAVLSSSPELLFDLSADGALQTRPIKGTVASPRGELGGELGGEPGGESGQDVRSRTAAASHHLLQSAKDRAEHLMIVDLERNDLGRVCRTGSVHVDPLFSIEKYEGLQHLVSSVRGQLRPGLGPCDVLAALFPGGSITGAPKIRAMEIIHELEPVARGIYTGAIGWITPEGEARMNLAIRTLTQHGGHLDLHVGGGIVFDSDPESEFEECRIKGEAMARAVELAERMAVESGLAL